MKIRKQTYSLEQYLKLMNAETIRTDQECQRMAGQWTSNMVSELIYTVLTDNYIPPIILGEETVNGIVRQWIMGTSRLQRTLTSTWSLISGKSWMGTKARSGMQRGKSSMSP